MELQNLAEIFNNKIFRIPDYQRGYSWNNNQLEDLWLDLSILENSKIHYTGVLSVKKHHDNDIYHVIDGQQRLTTIIILIKVICDKFEKNNQRWVNGKELQDYIKTFLFKKTGQQGEITTPIFGYEKDNPSDIFFRTKILNLSNTDDSTPDDTLYTKNIKNAKSFFEEKLKKKDSACIEKLLKKITENLKFNFYKIEDELNEFVAFETMNNRGKPLTTLELLKNRLIYLSTLLPKNDDEEKRQLRNDINNSWKTIYEYLGKNREVSLKDDDFLHDHWILNFPYSREESKVYREALLTNFFTVTRVMYINRHDELRDHFSEEQLRQRTLTYEDIKNYIIDIQKTVKHYYFIHNPIDTTCPYPDIVKKWLSKLNRLGFRAFKPLILSLLVRKIDDEKTLKILEKIEKFIFVNFNILHSQSNYKNSHFYRWAKEIHKSETPMNKVDELLKDTILQNEDDQLGIRFIRKINEKEKSFYDWRGRNYFLYEYELSLQEKYHGELKVEWEHVNNETIEHIYPQTANKDCWTIFDNHQFLLHDLGNLLLLARKINSGLQNDCFSSKKERFSINSYSAIEASKHQEWTPSVIQQRREKMLEFLEKRWDVSIKEEAMNELNNLNLG